MIINIIDYRGSDPDLFNYRTEKFLEIQKDFEYWRPQHEFICWTQHSDFDNLKILIILKLFQEALPHRQETMF